MFSTDPTAPFTDRITDHNPEAAQELTALFHSLCLPVPHEGEYMRRRHGDLLLPVSPAGCLVQITPREHSRPVLRHAQVLQPLAELQSRHWVVRLLPGVHLNANEEQCDVLRRELRSAHIDFHDNVLANIGTLPGGVPVVIDNGAARALPGYQPPAQPDIQDRLYAGLRAAAAQALAAPGRPQAMHQFWKHCAENCRGDKPVLVAGWKHVMKRYGDDSKSRDLKSIAEEYGHHFTQYSHRYGRTGRAQDEGWNR